ncbi:MAG: hypothetical protein IIA72_05715, partial [Proteobacteria bacterium]|nr:hypothetical protein [Pseudomonadota bacterium]
GTAFDYILRFHLEKQHPIVITQPWIAQRAFGRTVAGSWQHLPEADVAARLAEIFADAKLEHGRFLTTGQITTDLLASTLSLAHCDTYYRTMLLGDRFWDRPEENEIEELRDLVKVIDKDRLSANEVCLLNPDFGRGSTILGGADADLLLDDCLIEIKTTERLQVRVKDWRQLLGYAALNEHFPIGGRGPHPIRSIGIYFARYGYFVKWPIRHIVDPHKFSQFALMLAKYGTAMHKGRLEWESKDDHQGARRLYFEDLRHGEAPDDLYLNLDPITLSFTREGYNSNNEAVQVLEDNEGRMASRAALRASIMAYTGKQKAWAYRIITEALKDGQIDEVTKGGEVRLKRP